MTALRRALSRFTPTGVGTIPRDLSQRREHLVHPHGRGDNSNCVYDRPAGTGSPPRAWGQLRTLVRCSAIRRFTPTGVGTMTVTRTPTPTETVHPHGRGDNESEPEPKQAKNGSPPRAWGQYTYFAGAYPGDRFTPTGVGTILYVSANQMVRPVHPHGRGDNLHPVRSGIRHNGSPPRAWGQ